jgi:hypothetical protein
MLGQRKSKAILPPDLARISQLRATEIRLHFAEIDRNAERKLSFEEIYAFLCGKSGQSFDRTLLEEIYSSLEKESMAYISITELAACYSDIEVVLERKVDDLRTKVSEDRLTIDEHRRKMLEAKATTQYNSHGVMVGSCLNVDVLEVSGLKAPPQTKGVRVSLALDGQTFSTDPLAPNKTIIWSQSFKFVIESGVEVLFVTCSTTDRKLLGEVQIPLQNLKKQDQVEQLFDLVQGTTGWNGKVLLRLQWFWDLVTYHESMATEWSQRSSTDQAELQQLEAKLFELRKPFSAPAPSILVHPQVRHVEQMISESMDTLAVRAFGES